MVGERAYVQEILDFCRSENQKPLEETFAYRYLDDLPYRLKYIKHPGVFRSWSQYWHDRHNPINVAGFICDRFSDGIRRDHWLPFNVQEIWFRPETPYPSPKYLGGHYSGPTIDQLAKSEEIAAYFSRFLSVPNHKLFEESIARAADYFNHLTLAKQVTDEGYWDLEKLQAALQRFNMLVSRRDDIQMEMLGSWEVPLFEGVPIFIFPKKGAPHFNKNVFFRFIYKASEIELNEFVFNNPLILNLMAKHKADLDEQRDRQILARTNQNPAPE